MALAHPQSNEPSLTAIIQVLDKFLDAPTWGARRKIIEAHLDLLRSITAIGFIDQFLTQTGSYANYQIGRVRKDLNALMQLMEVTRRSNFAIAWKQFEASQQQQSLSALLDEWLVIESSYDKRVLLENHLELLTPQSEEYLQTLMAINTDDRQVQEVLASHLWLLQDVRQRGGTAEAVREAYINMASVSVLDLPFWLKQIMQEVNALSASPQALRRRIILLSDALLRVERDDHIIQEVRAELQISLGQLLQETLTADSDGQKATEEVIALYREAAKVYDRVRYPLRYASLMNNLALVYMCHPTLERGPAIEYAIVHMQEAASLYPPEHFPVAWAQTQSNLGEFYRMRPTSDLHERTQNLKQALIHHERALQVFKRNL